MNQPLSLFLDGHCFDGAYQGTHSFVRELYRSIHESGAAIKIFVGARDPERARQALPFLQPENILAYRRHRIPGLRFLTDIPKWIRERRFDFAHFQYIAPPQVGTCRYIVTTHDLLFRDFRGAFPAAYRLARDPLFRNSIRRAEIRTTVSAYSRERIAHHYGLPEEDLHVIPCSISPRWGEHLDRDEAKRKIRERYGLEHYLLCVSRIEPRKNQDLLLRVFLSEQLYHRGLHLVLVGSSSIPSTALNALLAGLNPEQRRHVHHLEQVPPQDLEALYAAARLFVYPSKGEGFGIPPLEAALCRVPVLCSGATAMNDFDFFDPWRFEPGDVDSFTEKLRSLLEAPPADHRLEAVRRQVTERFSGAGSARRFLQLLQTHPA